VLGAASGGGAHTRPERFAAAPYVIQVDPNLQVSDSSGTLGAVPLQEQPAMPAAAVAALTGAIPDRSFYAQVQGIQAPPASTGPALGHGWSSAAFAPYVLTSGHAPRADDEIVVAGAASVGSRVTVVTAAGPRGYTVAGTVAPRIGEQPVFFTDAEAARLSPGIDALVTGSAATAARAATLAAALPAARGYGRLEVLTGTARHEADPGALRDATELSGLTTFLDIAALLSAFVAVTVTATAFGLSVAQRRRDLALLRTIGATPGQVMRMICAEAAIVGMAGAVAGCLLGVVFAPVLSAWIVRQGLAPSWFGVDDLTPASALALAAAFVAGVGVATASAGVAARRAGAIRPTQALREADVEARRHRTFGLIMGLICLCSGILGLAAIALFFQSAAADPKSVAEVVIALIGGTALLAPSLLRWLTWPFNRGTAGMLLRANIVTGSGRAAAALVPVLITAGLAMSILGANDTASAAASAAQRQQAAGAGFVVLPAAGTPGLTAALLDQIHGVSGVAATAVTDAKLLARQPQITALHLDSLHLESPVPLPYPAIGIDQPSAALRLTVTAGSLTGLDGNTVAVDSSWGKHVGDTMSLWRPDGSPVTLKVIAVVASTMSGPSLIVDPRNAGAAMPDRVYVKADSAAAQAALLGAVRSSGAWIVPVSAWTANVSDTGTQQNQVGLELLLGIAVAYSLIGIANTFLMSVGGRRSELALLHNTGATRRQVVWFVGAESLAITAIGLVLSAVIAGLVLLGIELALAGETGSAAIRLPWPTLGVLCAACVVLAAGTSTVPAWFQFRRR
jgi:putative ABC transport system permease protein